jgi:hypothetical protein
MAKRKTPVKKGADKKKEVNPERPEPKTRAIVKAEVSCGP